MVEFPEEIRERILNLTYAFLAKNEENVFEDYVISACFLLSFSFFNKEKFSNQESLMYTTALFDYAFYTNLN